MEDGHTLVGEGTSRGISFDRVGRSGIELHETVEMPAKLLSLERSAAPDSKEAQRQHAYSLTDLEYISRCRLRVLHRLCRERFSGQQVS